MNFTGIKGTHFLYFIHRSSISYVDHVVTGQGGPDPENV